MHLPPTSWNELQECLKNLEDSLAVAKKRKASSDGSPEQTVDEKVLETPQKTSKPEKKM